MKNPKTKSINYSPPPSQNSLSANVDKTNGDKNQPNLSKLL